jgi:hypothetical protein
VGGGGSRWEAVGGGGSRWEAVGGGGRRREAAGGGGRRWEAAGGGGRRREAAGYARGGRGRGQPPSIQNAPEITAFLFKNMIKNMYITTNTLLRDFEQCSALYVQLIVLKFSSQTRKQCFGVELELEHGFVRFVQLFVPIFPNDRIPFCTIS